MNTQNIDSIFNKQSHFFSTGKTKDIQFRKDSLKKLHAALMAYELPIKDALKKDLGRSETETFLAETMFVCAEIKHTLKHLKCWMKPKKVSTTLPLLPAKSIIKPEPKGVVLIIGPWNYPLQLVIGPLVASISAGNCAVLKPSELAPETSKLVAEIISKTFPEEYIAVVEGGIEETQTLLQKKWDHIFYTGSTQVGKIIMSAAAQHLTPVTLELGGKSPCIVDSKLNIEAAANRIVWGKFVNAGQTCVAPDYILVKKDFKSSFIQAIEKTIQKFYGANIEQSPDYPRIVNQRHFGRLMKLMESQKIIRGGKSNASNLYIEPTLIDEPGLNSPIMQEEIFGPLLPILTYEKIDDAIQLINSRPKPLALYAFSSDKAFQNTIIEKTTAGGMCVNDTIIHLSSTNLPFGGVGDSGMGSYHGKWGFDAFSHFKSILKKPFFADNSLRYPPYQKSIGIVKKLYYFLYGKT